MQRSLNQLLSEASIVFWDFDGVIKESVEVKSLAFQKLFLEFERDAVEAIGEHHENNSGLSRFIRFQRFIFICDQQTV